LLNGANSLQYNKLEIMYQTCDPKKR